MRNLIAALALSVSVSGCELIPQNPTGDVRGEVARVYIAVELLADQIGTAQQQGLIDTEEEDRLLDLLDAAVVSASVVDASKDNTLETQGRLEKIRRILEEVRNDLVSEREGK